MTNNWIIFTADNYELDLALPKLQYELETSKYTKRKDKRQSRVSIFP